MKKQKHATTNPAELGKLLRILGTKKQREREPVAWYQTGRGLAVRLYAGEGCYVIAGEPGTVAAAARGEIGTSRASFAGRIDSITGAGADVEHAYQAAEVVEGTDSKKEAPAGEPLESWRLPEQMVEALGWCNKAAATDTARLVLQTVAVQTVAGGVRIVAGDNYRIHLASTGTETPEHAAPVRQLMAPRRLAAYLASRGEPVAVHYHEHTATMDAPGFYATWSDTRQAWPDFRSVIPAREAATGSAGINAAQMLEAVEAVEAGAAVELAIAGKSRDMVRLVALATGAHTVEIGAGTARRSIAAAGSGAGAATLNAGYLLDALEGFTGSGAVGIHTTAQTSPVVFRGVAGRVAVVMPVRLPENSELVRELIEKAAPAAELEPVHA
jgi:hypothetical protein